MTTATDPKQATVSVAELTGSERTVALYASDMPTQRGRATSEQYREWIVQGLARLGACAVAWRAECAYGFRLLEMSGLLTEQILARHEQRFPDARRLARAGQVAANSTIPFRMSRAALARNGAARVDGECPCAGRGSVEVAQFPDVACSLPCPVHAGTARGVAGVAR